MTPDEYEKAVLERFRTLWPPPRFVVKHNIKLLGSKTKKRRQIDIGVFENGESEPFLIADAKRSKRSIDAQKIGSTIALVQDTGKIPAVMVSTSDFSVAAMRHLSSEGIECLTITLKEAHGLRWLPFIEQHFAADRQFRELSGHLVEAVGNNDFDPLLDNDLPYEEWLAVLAVSQSRFPDSTCAVLKSLALNHFDDGVRWNAIQLLDEAGQLDTTEIENLLSHERDPENAEFLQELLNQAR